MKSTLVIFLVILLHLVLSKVDGLASCDNTTIQIPVIGAQAQVIPVYVAQRTFGTTWDVSGLEMTAGSFTGLSTFGQAGNTVIRAHAESADGSPDLFYDLSNLQVGNRIYVVIDDQTFIYEVTQSYFVDARDLHPYIRQLINV